MIFQFEELGDLDKPLTHKILMDPNHAVTKQILYIYSMESFIYPALNKVSRDQIQSQIKHYGAFAAALSCILYFANKNRKESRLYGTTTLYRGLQLPFEDIDDYERGHKIYLRGYTSTSKNLATAKHFAFNDL